LSSSGIKKFNQCPRKFEIHYLIEELEPPDEGEIEHFQIGNTIHDSLEEALNELESIPEKEKELLETLEEKENHQDYNYSDNDKVDTCLKTASRWISSFVEEIKHVEEEWSMEKSDITYNGLADLVADIDLGDEDDPEIYENVIIDWKTGKENEEWKERIQAGMYIEMFYQKFGHYPDAAVFVYLDEETQSFHSRIQNGEVFWNEHENKYWTEIEKIKNEILHTEQTGDWETKPETANCYWCDYKLYCEDSPVGAENAEKRHINIGEIV